MDTSHDGRHVCGVPERSNGSICRWDKTNWDGGQFVGEPQRCKIWWDASRMQSDWLPALRAAWAMWRAVCAIEPIEITVPLSPMPNARVDVGMERIDKPGDTLAYAYLPCGPDSPLGLLFDTSELWWKDPTRAPQNGIDVRTVALHEIGHNLGINHDVRNGSKSLMRPSYSAGIRELTEWDIQQAVMRYGPAFDGPVPGTPPTTPTPTPGAKPAVIEIDGVKWTGTLTRVA